VAKVKVYSLLGNGLRDDEWERRARRVLTSLQRIGHVATNQAIKVRKGSPCKSALMRTLKRIVENEGISVQELAESMGVHQSTVSNLVEKLKASGYVVKKRESSDRRIVSLYSTDAGKQSLTDAEIGIQFGFPEPMKHLSAAELEGIENALVSLAGRLGFD
jgi:MarR family transcriptional regulator, organic hydroperoxide resistance regulator